MTAHEIVLHGCTPEPLMSYLKALGVLRLVAEQKDPTARGCWRDGVFVLRSTIGEEDIISFFVLEYEPTPVIVPWSGGDFFGVNPEGDAGPFKKTPTSTQIIEAILATKSSRLARYRKTIDIALNTLKECEIHSKEQMKDELKLRFISVLRSRVSESAVSWIDTCASVVAEKPYFNSLLGSGGGSDGNTHFSDNFMQNLWEVLPDFDFERIKTTAHGADALRTALFASLSAELVYKRTSSLFDGGAVGGPNAGQGFERASLGSPWSFILCLEGALFFAGSVTQRQPVGGRANASFPFQTRLTVSDLNSTADKEMSGKELWLPLWNKWSTLNELVALLGEGRSSIGRRKVERGVDFARAAVSLGIDRGINSFQRFGIVKGRVGGDNYNTSAPLGRFDVRIRPGVDLIKEPDRWLDRFRHAASDENAPPRFKVALRRIDSAIIDFCQYGDPSRFTEILCALGRAERELANGERFRKEKFLKPLSRLSSEWLRAAYDGSIEFELALALAGIYDSENKTPDIRANLEPIDGFKYRESNNGVVWTGADLTSNLISVLERRVLDGDRKGCSRLPLAFKRAASIEAISSFIAGEVNDSRLNDLLWGMLLVNHAERYPEISPPRIVISPPLPRAYALLKLLFLPYPLDAENVEITIKPEPGILALLRAGRAGEACVISLRRLRTSGLTPMPHRMGGSRVRDADWAEIINGADSRRLAAALLIPISSHSVTRIKNMITRPVEEINSTVS